MPIYIGGTKISDFNIGNVEIDKLYVGNVLVYEKTKTLPSGTVLVNTKVAGSYDFEMTATQNVIIDLVSGGAGGATSRYSHGSSYSGASASSGGSGAWLHWEGVLPKGKYTVEVGAGSPGVGPSWETSTSSASAGNTRLIDYHANAATPGFEPYFLLTGGGGATAHAGKNYAAGTGGKGGAVTDFNLLSGVATIHNGNDGTNASSTSYHGTATANDVASPYTADTSVGKGGGGATAEDYNGNVNSGADGLAKIVIA